MGICLFLILPFSLLSQNDIRYRWINPVEDNRIEFSGQGWSHDVLASPYDRLPEESKKSVRDPVWNLSRYSTGIYLTFSTDAKEIQVRYGVSGSLQLLHMPATGVSGVDLYSGDASGENWIWCPGRYHLADTITYTCNNLNTRTSKDGQIYNYRLYLPLRNSVQWMEIGVPEEAVFSASPKESKKPVVVYGTSIAQGGVASRPAMAWTNILQRSLNRPVINLGFAGQGRLEPEVVRWVNEIDAVLFVLDCLPNLTSEKSFPEQELKSRVKTTVKSLKEQHPLTPVLLTEHAGYSSEWNSRESYDRVRKVNLWQKEAYEELKREGVKEIYLLSKDEIDMCMDCTVDGTHPTDLGMEYYAKAYDRIIRKILYGTP